MEITNQADAVGTDGRVGAVLRRRAARRSCLLAVRHRGRRILEAIGLPLGGRAGATGCCCQTPGRPGDAAAPGPAPARAATLRPGGPGHRCLRAAPLVGGITRFVFGREVVDAAHSAFPNAPGTFPAYLDVPAKPTKADNEPNKALAALEDAAKAVGADLSAGVMAAGTGVASAADVVTRPFRSVDLDGDGVPDEPQALTAVKGAGGAIAGAAGAVGDDVSGLFKPRKRGKHAAGGPQREVEAGADEDVTEE